MSIHKKKDGLYEVRWRESGRNKSVRVRGSVELAKKIERKRMSVRDENRHLDIKREINFRMSALIDRYWEQYGAKKRSADREKSIVEGIRDELGKLFVREVDGIAVSRWYANLTAVRGLSEGTAVRHFNVVHHMLEKASTIWSKETGLGKNPAGDVEVRRPDDARDCYLSESELRRLKAALDQKRLRKGTKDVNRTIQRMRLIVLIALTTGMRSTEIFGLRCPDVMYEEGLLAVRAKLKGGKTRYVPLLREVAGELNRYPVVISDDRIFPPRKGAYGSRRRLEGKFRGFAPTCENLKLPLSRSVPHICVVVHDEWRRSVRTRQDPGPFKHQNDRTLCKARQKTDCQNRKYRSGDLEADGARIGRQSERRLTMFAYCSRIPKTPTVWLTLSC